MNKKTMLNGDLPSSERFFIDTMGKEVKDKFLIKLERVNKELYFIYHEVADIIKLYIDKVLMANRLNENKITDKTFTTLSPHHMLNKFDNFQNSITELVPYNIDKDVKEYQYFFKPQIIYDASSRSYYNYGHGKDNLDLKADLAKDPLKVQNENVPTFKTRILNNLKSIRGDYSLRNLPKINHITPVKTLNEYIMPTDNTAVKCNLTKVKNSHYKNQLKMTVLNNKSRENTGGHFESLKSDIRDQNKENFLTTNYLKSIKEENEEISKSKTWTLRNGNLVTENFENPASETASLFTDNNKNTRDLLNSDYNVHESEDTVFSNVVKSLRTKTEDNPSYKTTKNINEAMEDLGINNTKDHVALVRQLVISGNDTLNTLKSVNSNSDNFNDTQFLKTEQSNYMNVSRKSNDVNFENLIVKPISKMNFSDTVFSKNSSDIIMKLQLDSNDKENFKSADDAQELKLEYEESSKDKIGTIDDIIPVADDYHAKNSPIIINETSYETDNLHNDSVDSNHKENGTKSIQVVDDDLQVIPVKVENVNYSKEKSAAEDDSMVDVKDTYL